MHPAIIAEYVRKRMEELGYGDNYHLRLRHIAVPPRTHTTIDVENQLMILLEPVEQIHIESDLGVFELNASTGPGRLFEMQYEHTGRIKFDNYDGYEVIHLQFLQVIGVDRSPIVAP